MANHGGWLATPSTPWIRRPGPPSPSTRLNAVFTTRARIWSAETTLIYTHQLKTILKLLKHTYYTNLQSFI